LSPGREIDFGKSRSVNDWSNRLISGWVFVTCWQPGGSKLRKMNIEVYMCGNPACIICAW
jgi:hypothetical protein